MNTEQNKMTASARPENVREIANVKMTYRDGIQESYGNRLFYRVDVPAGREISEYLAALQREAIYCHDQFKLENGEIIRSIYCSIGD